MLIKEIAEIGSRKDLKFLSDLLVAWLDQVPFQVEHMILCCYEEKPYMPMISVMKGFDEYFFAEMDRKLIQLDSKCSVCDTFDLTNHWVGNTIICDSCNDSKSCRICTGTGLGQRADSDCYACYGRGY